MPRKRKKSRRRELIHEEFHFAVERWDFSNSLWTRPERSSRGYDPVTDYREVKLEGPLISNTRREVQRGELLVWPSGPAPSDWPEDRGIVGSLLHFVDGRMTVVYSVTEESFLGILTVATTGRIVEFSVTIRDLRYRRGQVVGVCLGTERTEADNLP